MGTKLGFQKESQSEPPYRITELCGPHPWLLSKHEAERQQSKPRNPQAIFCTADKRRAIPSGLQEGSYGEARIMIG